MLWDPAQHKPEETRLAEFSRFIGVSGAFDQKHFEAIQNWAVQNPAAFWNAVWDFGAVIGERSGEVIAKIRDVPWARFFDDSKISYAENMLAHVERKPNTPAIIARTQDQADRIITWKGLAVQVSLMEQALRGAGVGEGDKVAVYLSNIPETIIILLAASNIGAVFVSAGMEMGPDDLINRFSLVNPKILITADGYVHGAKGVDRLEAIRKVQAAIPSIQLTVVIPMLREAGEVITLDNATDIGRFIAPFSPKELKFTRRAFNHPLYILFSSGSTGKPKCFEHSSGGILLKHLSEYILHCDVWPGDRVFYHATPSWMMWNWLAGGLAVGATLLMYDGAPAYPDVYAQWRFTAEHKCTHHGTAAPVILSWATAKAEPKENFNLSDLRMILSTGAVLPAQGFEYIHEHVKEDVKISSISGGTDIVGCFVGGNPFTPTYAGQVNGPMLGLDVDIWDEEGRSVPPGGTGELVCKNAFPSMPLRFVGDEGGAKYRAEYFEHYKEAVWRHGDSVERTREGQFVIVGRSDATLKQNGVRIGPVAIYDQLKVFSERVREAAAVEFTRPDNKQPITVLFLALQDGAASVPDDLAAAIKKAVKDNVTPYAIPTEIIAVPGVLKTPNGKTAEVVIKKILAGKSIPNASLYGEELVKNFEKIGKDLVKKYG